MRTRTLGHRVAVRTGGRTVTGVVIHAGADFLTLETAATTVKVHLRRSVVLTVAERAPSGAIGGDVVPSQPQRR